MLTQLDKKYPTVLMLLLFIQSTVLSIMLLQNSYQNDSILFQWKLLEKMSVTFNSSKICSSANTFK